MQSGKTLIACLGLWLLAMAAQAAVQPLNRIVAVVNDDVITATELDRRLAMIRDQIRAADNRMPPEEVLRKQVLDRMVLEKLQLQLAERNHIRVDDETLNNALRGIARQNGLSLDDFRQVLENDGQDWAEFREEIRRQIQINQLRQQMVGARITVSEQEVDNLLASQAAWGSQNREYHLGHILIEVPEAASPEEVKAARARAEEVLTKLRQGTDFAKLAIQYSSGQNALSGGDLGWRKAGRLPSLFAERVQEMQPGDISGLIRSPSGFHIIKLLETRGDERRLVAQTRVRHILLKPDRTRTEAETRTRLQQLRERIRNGESFANLARSHSQDKVSAARGGDLGWVSPGDLVPRFEEAMNKLQPGEVSEPVKTRFGWHLIQVLERRKQDNTEAFRRARAREMIRKRKIEEELQLWLRRLRDEAYVEYRLEG